MFDNVFRDGLGCSHGGRCVPGPLFWRWEVLAQELKASKNVRMLQMETYDATWSIFQSGLAHVKNASGAGGYGVGLCSTW